MRLGRLAETTEALRATSSRTAKAELLAEVLSELAPSEIVPAVGFLLATPRQGAIGVGWATVARLDQAAGDDDADGDDDVGDAGHDTADILGFDRVLTEIATTTGPGSEAARTARLHRFLAACSPAEAELVRRVLVGDARQGALAGVMTDAVARATGVKAATMRRGVMLQGDLGEAAYLALTGGTAAVEAIDLQVGRPIQPMLAATAADVEEALAAHGGRASVEWKLDGARIQVHLVHGDDVGSVSIYTRSLNDVTSRLPQVAEIARSLPCRSAVLDGELLGFFGDDDAPRAFQDTMSAFGTEAGADEPDGVLGDQSPAAGLRPHFFDVMYVDGRSLIDAPLSERLAALDALAPHLAVPRAVAESPEEAAAVLDEALARGHEGVMVKALDGAYEAGRRGRAWRKVKPVHTLDLVVLAAEWGHGRRRGWLSNLHLGALDPETGEPVMVGKTFKGLTDELLRWQTEEFQARKVRETDHTVWIRPDLVVEIALDGAQVSTRYPGGVALRFARVRRYRPDKEPASADTLEAVRALLPRS